jgi:uncharacterized protein with von Willebrand factor type A (vWA) domain
MLPFAASDPDRSESVSNTVGVQAPATFHVDLPVLASAFGQRLHDAGMPVTPAQSEWYARSLQLTKPRSRAALYYTTRAIFCTGSTQLRTFDRVYGEIFGPCETSGAATDPAHWTSYA